MRVQAALWSALVASLATYAANVGVLALHEWVTSADGKYSLYELLADNAARMMIVSIWSSMFSAVILVPAILWTGRRYAIRYLVVSLLIVALFALPHAVAFLPKGEDFSASVGACQVYEAGTLTECGWELRWASLWHPIVLAAVYGISLMVTLQWLETTVAAREVAGR